MQKKKRKKKNMHLLDAGDRSRIMVSTILCCLARRVTISIIRASSESKTLVYKYENNLSI